MFWISWRLPRTTTKKKLENWMKFQKGTMKKLREWAGDTNKVAGQKCQRSKDSELASLLDAETKTYF